MEITDILKEHSEAIELRLKELGVADIGSIEARLYDMEQKAARPGGPRDDRAATWGAEFIASKSADVAHLVQSRGSIGAEMKTTITTDAASAGGLIVPQRDQVLGMPQRRLTVRNLLTAVAVSSGSVEYPQMTARPSAADVVAEGALKPESAMTFDLVNVPIRTIAHWIPASLQVLDDAPQLRDLIDSELVYGLALKEEQQLLNGSGTGQNLSGMVTLATAFDTATLTTLGITTPNRIDVLGAAIYQATLTDVPPDGVVVHPADWWACRLTKDADGKYIYGDPSIAVTPVVHGLPVVPTQAMAADTFMVGSFKSQTLYDRWTPRVEVSTEHADFFTRNLCAIRAEERIGSAVKRPEALIYGTFSTAMATV